MDYNQVRIDAAQKNKANIPVTPSDTNVCKELFISEMIEGTAKNKALEIFNPTDSVVDLINFAIRIFHNGQLTPIKVPLSGTIAPKSTHVIAHPSANNDIKAKANEFDTKINFDGNDAIVLEKGNGGNYIDKIGEIGVNPGNAGWTCTSGSTKDHTLRRKGNIGEGEMDWQNKCRNQWDDFPKDNSANLKQHQGACAAAANDLSLSIANAIETGVLPTKFLEFDIMVEANDNSTYFDNALTRLSYNTTAFGTNIVANGKITVTKGATYSDITYIDPDTLISDFSASEVTIPFGQNLDGPWNRTLVTTTPTQLVHVKIEITSCNNQSTIDFTDISFTPFFSSYTLNPTDDLLSTFSYDNTFYLNNLDVLLCVPNIVSFTSPVFPGTFYKGTTNTDYLLTITGTNFGVAQGFGNVYFIDANDPLFGPYVPLDAYDFISWSNTEIQIRMPSRMDSLPFREKTPGSGIFYVKTNLGDSVFSSTSIYMPYSITNALITAPTFKKLRYDLAGDQDSGAYVFRLDTSISNNPDAKATVIKAVNQWSCVTGVRWSVGADTILQGLIQDGVSIIYFDDIMDSALASTQIRTASCVNSFNDTIVYPKEMDIRIRRNLSGGRTWFYDTTEADLPDLTHDFYAVIEHELGHAHILKHVNNTDDLMYFESTPGPVSGIARKEVIFSIAATDGGRDDIMIRSTAIVLTPCAGVSVMFAETSPQNCTGGAPISINEYSKSFGDINTYPNPLGSGVLNIGYELKTRANVNFRIIDYTGKQIIAIDKGNLPLGKYRESINSGQLTPGFYFLIANVGGNVYTKKI